MDLSGIPVSRYHEALHRGEITCAATVEYFLHRIEQARHLNAYLEVFGSEALEQARKLDEQRKKGTATGKLHGVVFSLKDVICYKNHRATAGSRILSGFTSPYSATAVERLLKEEAIIIGRVNCDEFGMGSSNENSAYGKVLHPIDETRVPGGSSGGSAAAVKAGLCMISLGSDTGGSVRQPADFCGIIGLKPTYGRISRYGLIAYASSFDQIGILANHIEDVALTLEVMAGADPNDSTSSHNQVPEYSRLLQGSGKFNIACFHEAIRHPGLDREMAEKISHFIRQLKEQGHRVDILPFELMDYVAPAYYILTTAEASSNLSRYDAIKYGNRRHVGEDDITTFYKINRTTGFGKEVKRRIMLGTFVLSAGYYDAYFTKAQKVRKLVTDKILSVFKNYDFIIMPNSPVPAFKSGEKTEDPITMYLADIYTVMANMTGCPAISLPLFQHSEGIPFGLQVMANRFNELSLLRFSKQLLENNY
ncbi:MAG: Asp-tRNA(Asn)/Glu-tRNA(Gln) amidotransferase subunit GatA [Chitinophagaceae bacterium]|nr:Asp-tRNA(Asn)/Glu-tRNA(Gln) amidotransferase subunit GatA [Chitinophagaceae bacterium]